MQYNHEHLLADFASRTLDNLRLVREVQKSQPEKRAFEVTQLINSMLGLLVFPKERYLATIPHKTLSVLRAEGWPIPEAHPGCEPAADLRDFLRLMRNGIAHFNVEFLPDKMGEIAGLRIWNMKDKMKNWEVELTLEQLEGIAVNFIDLLKGENDMTNQDDHPIPNPSQRSQITWRRALIRSGFLFQANDGVFDLSQENEGNQVYLQSILARLGQQDHISGSLFSPLSTTVDETSWLAAIEKLRSAAEGGPSGIHDCDLRIMDTYMAGIVRWINAIGIKTKYSCDGHEKEDPKMMACKEWSPPLLDFIFQALSSGGWRFSNHRLFKRGERPFRSNSLAEAYDRHWLLDVAEALHQHQSVLQELVTAAKKVAYSKNQVQD